MNCADLNDQERLLTGLLGLWIFVFLAHSRERYGVAPPPFGVGPLLSGWVFGACLYVEALRCSKNEEGVASLSFDCVVLFFL